MKVSFITTVYNEQDNIALFLKSVFNQSQKPDEVIVVDGGSKDKTVEKINQLINSRESKGIDVRLIAKKGNRSVGRNEAIRLAQNEIITISDAGNILDRNWLKNIIKPFENKKTDVVAGYYKGLSKNIFQKCLIPFVLVMPDKAGGQEEFLPATRSMAIKKSVWKKAGGFDEKLSHNEDYAFANKLKSINVNFSFAKDAIVNWMPRQNLKSAFVMFFRFALGDIEAGILRTKVVMVFVRYFFLVYLLWLSLVNKSLLLTQFIILSAFSYLIWAAFKNYKYVKDVRAIFILPLIQLIADFSVISGSIAGFIKNLKTINYAELLKTNKTLLFIMFIYSLIVLSVIGWGIPNNNHPFTYHMDEWHFLGQLKSVIKSGSAYAEGGAWGPIFYSFLSAVYLVPFVIFGIINPFDIKSSVTELIIQRHIFEVLRLTTLTYGILNILVIYKILKEFFSKNWIIGVLIFVINPIFILWSTYYKYDIAVLFWLTLSVYAFLRYSKKPTVKNIIVASVVCALSIAVKFSNLPTLGMLFAAVLLFSKETKNYIKHISISFLIGAVTFLVMGIPDIFTKFNVYRELLSVNLWADYANIKGFSAWWETLIVYNYLSVIGYFTVFAFSISLVSLIIILLKNVLYGKINTYKKEIFIIVSLIFYSLSLYSLKMGASNGRMLVLLPFVAIIINLIFDRISNTNFKKIIIVFFIIGFLLQGLQVASWAYLKYQMPIQETSSEWIVKNIKKNSLIGVENIPIYQMIPDITLLEFYSKERSLNKNYLYKYEVIGATSKILPNTIILTSVDLDKKYLKMSSKQSLLIRMEKEGFKKIKTFSLNYKFYDLFSNRFNILYWNLVPGPSEISIYQKQTVNKILQ